MFPSAYIYTNIIRQPDDDHNVWIQKLDKIGEKGFELVSINKVDASQYNKGGKKGDTREEYVFKRKQGWFHFKIDK